MIKFGPSGNSDAFYEAGCKKSIQAPEWIHSLGLSAYEYQCSKGVKITEPTATILGENAKKYNIELSIHSPYYINLSSDGESREKAVNYIMQTLRAGRIMGAKRIVVHSGSCAKIPRDEALSLTKETLKVAINTAKEENLDDIYICPETMGKINQLGTFEEVIDICTMDKTLLPCFDFGHLYARSIGKMNSYDEFKKVFELLFSSLDEFRAKNFHAHFSRIEFTEKGGEKKHWRYEDDLYGPDFDPIARLIKEYDCSPTIICESMGTQAHDSLILQQIYEKIK